MKHITQGAEGDQLTRQEPALEGFNADNMTLDVHSEAVGHFACPFLQFKLLNQVDRQQVVKGLLFQCFSILSQLVDVLLEDSLYRLNFLYGGDCVAERLASEVIDGHHGLLSTQSLFQGESYLLDLFIEGFDAQVQIDSYTSNSGENQDSYADEYPSDGIESLGAGVSRGVDRKVVLASCVTASMCTDRS